MGRHGLAPIRNRFGARISIISNIMLYGVSAVAPCVPRLWTCATRPRLTQTNIWRALANRALWYARHHFVLSARAAQILLIAMSQFCLATMLKPV